MEICAVRRNTEAKKKQSCAENRNTCSAFLPWEKVKYNLFLWSSKFVTTLGKLFRGGCYGNVKEFITCLKITGGISLASYHLKSQQRSCCYSFSTTVMVTLSIICLLIQTSWTALCTVSSSPTNAPSSSRTSGLRRARFPEALRSRLDRRRMEL